VANIVAVTIRATNSTGNVWSQLKLDAAKAGAQAGTAFNNAFKLKASASVSGKGGVLASGSSGGIAGPSSQGNQLISRLLSNANQPGGIGILGAGPQGTALLSQLKTQLSKMGGLGVLPTSAGSGGSGGSSGGVASGTSTGAGSSPALARAIAANTNAVGNNTGASQNNTRSTNSLMSHLVSVFGNSNKSSGSSLGGLVGGILAGGGSGGSGGGGAIGAVSGALDSGGIAGGALPGIAGLSGMQATITGVGGALAAVLPAIVSVGAGIGVIGLGAKALIGTKNVKGQPNTEGPLYAQATGTMNTLQGIIKNGATAMEAPLSQAFSQISKYVTALGPQIKQLFAGAGPLIAPLVKALEGLVSGALPGFLSLIKAGGPVFDAFASSMTGLGKDLGSMLGDFASASGGSATILKSLMGLIGSLLPFVGDLAKILVSAVAPAVAAFAGALSSVLPALTPLMSILGSLAGAVLSDLAGVLGALGSLLTGLAPSFTLLAKVASSLFTTLENTGIFAILGNSLEALAGPIANLVNALVKGLAPSLPVIIELISQWSGVLATLIADGLAQLINMLVKVVTFISPLLPLVTGVYVAFKTWGAITTIVSAMGPAITAVTGAVTAMTAAMDFDTIALKAMYLWDGLVAVATKAWAIAQGILNAILDMNPFVAIGIAVVAIAALIIKYHTQIWNFITTTWDNVFSFLKTLWGNIEGTASSVWDTIKGVFSTALSDISGVFSTTWRDIENGVLDFATIALKSFRDIVNGFLSLVGSIINGAADAFGWVPGVGGKLQGAAKAFDNFKGSVNNAFDSMIGKVQGFQANINGMHGKTVNVGVTGSGSGGVQIATSGNSTVKFSEMIDLKSLATGGLLAGFGGGDILPALLEPGETVVDKDRTRKYAPLFKAMGVPGFAGGGKVLAFGASTTAGYNAPAGYNYVDQLQGFLGDGFNLVNAGIAGNELTSSGGVGVAGDKRFASLLKGVKAALAWEGINDLSAGVSAGGVEGGLANLIKTAHAVKIPVVLGTLQPANFTGAREKNRQSVNNWIRAGHGADAYADLDAILRSGPGSNHMAAWAYAGATGATKGIHPGPAGYDGVARVFDRALAQVIGGVKPVGWRKNPGSYSGGGLVLPGFSSGGLVNMESAVMNGMTEVAYDTISGAVKPALKDIVKAVTVANQANPSAGPGGGSPGANYALAQALYPAYKGTSVMAAWNNVAMRESGWNQFADNPSSGAYGIPQALPFTQMPKAAWPASAGGSSNPTAQIEWMWDYMASRYGGPIGAWDHELSAGWYDHGGYLPTGASIAYNTTGRPEPVGAAAMGTGGGVSDLHIVLELGDSFKRVGLSADQLKDLQYTVRSLGGKGNPNSVQKALGSI
jgi:phage-related protein/lysophospholipase L1-like esterase